jgi:transposase
VLSRWRREQAIAGEQAFQGHGKARDAVMARLKREPARVRKERDFLNEAAAFFAKASKWDTA